MRILTTFSDILDMSGYYRDQSYRDQYPRDSRYDQQYSRGWSGPSRTRSPEGRREYEDRYYAGRLEREAGYGARDRYDDRRAEIPYRDREIDRRSPYPPRREYLDRDREADYYDDRVPPPSRPHWGATRPAERSRSPQSFRRSPPLRRSSPSYSSSRAPVSPSYERKREEYARGPSQAITGSDPPYRDERIPTGPRAESFRYPRANVMPPTGPRSSMGRPPPASSSSYDDRSGGPPPDSSSVQRHDDLARKQSDSWSDDGGIPEKASRPPLPEAIASNDAAGWNEPPKAQEAVEVKEVAPLEAPKPAVIPVKDRLGKLEASDFVGSWLPDLEAQAFNGSTTRLRAIHSMYARPEFVHLRKALQGLADCDMDLAGAKLRTSITEAALATAKEEAEAWSLESARIEIKEKNMNPQDWFSVQHHQVV